ncbi:MAG: hypothetical protein HQ481_18060 [Alphaproteobacteria bacterium]|nr:hypothetical protein [Alphaproteobacteria bacterium]
MKMPTPSKNPVSRTQRHRDAIKLHEIEGNPFTLEDNAVFDMFEREGWTGEQRRGYIIGEARRRAGLATAAE